MASEIKKHFHCYLLQSQRNKHTYIGFTIDPTNRLSQHNGLKPGGAYRTKSHRPWKIILVMHNFETKVLALQFEWLWQHPERSKVMRYYLKKSRYYGVYGKLELLAMIFLLKDIDFNKCLNIWFLDLSWKEVFLGILKKNDWYVPNGIICEVRSLESMPYWQLRQKKQGKKRKSDTCEDEVSISDNDEDEEEMPGIEDNDDDSTSQGNESSSSSIISFDEQNQDVYLNERIRLAFQKDHTNDSSTLKKDEDCESSSSSSHFSFDQNDQDLHLNEMIRLAFDKDNSSVSSNQSDHLPEIETDVCYDNTNQSLYHMVSPNTASYSNNQQQNVQIEDYSFRNDDKNAIMNNDSHHEDVATCNSGLASLSFDHDSTTYDMRNTSSSNSINISTISNCNYDKNTSTIDSSDISVIDLCDDDEKPNILE